MNNREPENPQVEALKREIVRLEKSAAQQRQDAAQQREEARSEITRLRGIIEHLSYELHLLRPTKPPGLPMSAMLRRLAPIFVAGVAYGIFIFKYLISCNSR